MLVIDLFFSPEPTDTAQSKLCNQHQRDQRSILFLHLYLPNRSHHWISHRRFLRHCRFPPAVFLTVSNVQFKLDTIFIVAVQHALKFRNLAVLSIGRKHFSLLLRFRCSFVIPSLRIAARGSGWNSGVLNHVHIKRMQSLWWEDVDIQFNFLLSLKLETSRYDSYRIQRHSILDEFQYTLHL